MAAVTQDQLLSLALEVAESMAETLATTDEILREARALRLQLAGAAEDMRNISLIVARQEIRLERIENRIERAVPATA
jgi:hypothetical protein